VPGGSDGGKIVIVIERFKPLEEILRKVIWVVQPTQPIGQIAFSDSLAQRGTLVPRMGSCLYLDKHLEPLRDDEAQKNISNEACLEHH